MDPKLRAILTGFTSLAAILAIYLVYSQVSKTPQIEIDKAAGVIDVVPDSNIGGSDGEIAQIGNIKFDVVRQTKFEHRDKNGEVDREFGFERLLHKVEDIWQVQKPYMNVYQTGFKCYITADKGMVRLETALGRPTPKDATFTGNVVIHVVPEAGSDIEESFVYLNDVAFLSEKSQFSTAGPIRFTSHDGRLLGTGLELIYNDQRNRIDLFRLIDLESLHFTSSKAALFSSAASRRPALPTNAAEAPPVSSSGADVNNPDSATVDTQRTRPDKLVVADDSQDKKVPPVPNEPADYQPAGEYYRCVFRKNVVINMPKQWILADDEAAINNIFWPKSSDRKSGQAKTVGPDDLEQTDKSASEPREPNESSPQLVDIDVTCENGIIVTPMDSPWQQRDAGEIGTEPNVPDQRPPKDANGADDRATFVARRIEYDASTGNAAADGPLEITFRTTDVIGAAAKGSPSDFPGPRSADDGRAKTAPVKITAQDKAEFLTASNQVVFQGGCKCTMLRHDPNGREKFELSSELLTIDLPAEANDRSVAWAGDIEHLTADGGVVKLVTVRSVAEEVLGGIELKCRKLDYDRQQQLFSAAGPGMIKIDNSSVPEPNEQVPGFSLKRPSWVIIENFDTLEYFIDANRFIADANSQRITIKCFPLVKGQYRQPVKATAGRIEATLTRTADGQTEVSTLYASGGITYQDGDNEFSGSELFYDHDKSMVEIWGDESQPCYFNGVLVDEIEIDLKTGRVKGRVPVPGTLQTDNR